MPDARRAGLRAAAEVIARFMRRVAAVKSDETALAVNIVFEGQEVAIRAGRPGGAYGWKPIQALMLDDNRRHPLFGNTGHWYYEGYYPITEETVQLSADYAAAAYADVAIPLMLEEYGLAE